AIIERPVPGITRPNRHRTLRAPRPNPVGIRGDTEQGDAGQGQGQLPGEPRMSPLQHQPAYYQQSAQRAAGNRADPPDEGIHDPEIRPVPNQEIEYGQEKQWEYRLVKSQPEVERRP